jgi:hypothetical protein
LEVVLAALGAVVVAFQLVVSRMIAEVEAAEGVEEVDRYRRVGLMLLTLRQ